MDDVPPPADCQGTDHQTPSEPQVTPAPEWCSCLQRVTCCHGTSCTQLGGGVTFSIPHIGAHHCFQQKPGSLKGISFFKKICT